MPETVQDKGLVFALDIGTRSIVGVLGREEGGRFHVLDIEKEEHGRRAMLDGQIEDIAQVASIANIVIERLEARQQIRLRKVCVAAAGRALKSAKASFTLEFTDARQADDETVNQLEAGAVSAAESVISDGSEGMFYMVGYTASQYRLDGYPMSTLHGHRGRVMEADVVATFLPREVVDSLYTVVARLGLEISSLTLEPIASLNAAIPIDIRLLNLVLVDIGAGTSDIAVCRDGSVAGYTMATVAGDEVTELLMKKLLIDFRTAEALKMGIGGKEALKYVDILGIPQECSSEMLLELIEPAVQLLAGEIAGKVLELNGAPPSAVFLAGGGSKLHGLRQAVAAALGMDEARVAIAGNHFERNAFSEEFDLNDPEYSTPLGIAVSAALGMINDSYVVTLNGAPAKLFRSGTLSVRDILLMNGCRYGDMMGRTGANLVYTLNGARQFVRGTHGIPPVIRLNGAAAELADLVHAGDNVDFTPAKAGANATRTLGEALGERFSGGVTVNGMPQPLSYRIGTGDVIETGSDLPMPLPDDGIVQPVKEAETPPPSEPKVLRSHAVVLSSEPAVPVRKETPEAGRLSENQSGAPGEEAAPAAHVLEPQHGASAEGTPPLGEPLQFDGTAPSAAEPNKGFTVSSELLVMEPDADVTEDSVEERREAPTAPPAPPAVEQREMPTAPPVPPVVKQREMPTAPPVPPEVEQREMPTAPPVPPAVKQREMPTAPPVPPVVKQREMPTAPPVPPAVKQREMPTAPPVPLTAEQNAALAAAQALSQAAAAAIQGAPSDSRPVPHPGHSAAFAEAQKISQAAAAALRSTPEPRLARHPQGAAQAAPAAGTGEAEPVPQTAEAVPQEDAGAPQSATYPPVRQTPKRRGIPRVILPNLPVFQSVIPRGRRPLQIRLNGEPLILQPKANGDPYYFMDILQYSGLDFNRLERPVEMLLNGMNCEFTQTLAENDDVVVRYQD